MDTVSSAEFRKRYAKLSRPTVITVNGHPIGRWTPIRSQTTSEWPPDPNPADMWGDEPPANWPAFNSRPFTPVPKTRK